MDARAQSIDQKIKLIDQQLAKSRDQIKKIRPGPSQDAVKKRALIILKQKKMYEHQRDQLYSQQYNVDSVAFATENAKATVDTVRAMKAASKELKTQFKQKEFDIDKIDSLNDQMADLLEYNEEVQEVLGQSYATPEDIDEDGLMDELDALELDLEEDLVEDFVEDLVEDSVVAFRSGFRLWLSAVAFDSSFQFLILCCNIWPFAIS